MCIANGDGDQIVAPVTGARTGGLDERGDAVIAFDIGAPPGIPGGAIIYGMKGEIGLCCAPVGVLRMNREGARRLSRALARAGGDGLGIPTRTIMAATVVASMLAGWGIAAWIG